MSRPSGISLIENGEQLVTVNISYVENRGRLNILPRWRSQIDWLSSARGQLVEALMILDKPGLISLRDWQTQSPPVLERIAYLSTPSDADNLEALRLIFDRYRRLEIPANDRVSLGEAALAHLRLEVGQDGKSLLYVTVSKDRIELMSPKFRDERLLAGHHLVDDLP